MAESRDVPPRRTTHATGRRTLRGECPAIRYGLVARIPGFHPGGSGSIPGIGTTLLRRQRGLRGRRASTRRGGEWRKRAGAKERVLRAGFEPATYGCPQDERLASHLQSTALPTELSKDLVQTDRRVAWPCGARSPSSGGGRASLAAAAAPHARQCL